MRYLTHFSTRTLADPEDESSLIEVSELVEPGQKLVSTTTDTDEKDPEELTLEAGPFTELDSETGCISSTVHGYPSLAIKSSGKQGHILASVTPLLTISGDFMEATLSLMPELAAHQPADARKLLDIFAKERISYGIDTVRLDQVIRQVAESDRPSGEVIIARGKAPKDGRDSYLRMEIEIGPLPGKVMANGSIDFRERQMFVGVKKGQLIATRIPPTQGKPGITIFGDPLPARDGKDLAVKITGDTLFNEANGTVHASDSGVLSAINDDTLRVATKQKIEGDVNYSTGNIRSQNSVEITGSVLPDFLVSTKGNLLIGGNVESAAVKCRGNVEVKGGILGREAYIHARGDIDVKYIERGSLTADGNIIIRKGSYYSSLQAGDAIHCPETVKLIGGSLIARNSISGGVFGSSSASPMQLAAGVEPGRYRYYLDLLEEYEKTLEEIQSRFTLYGHTTTKEQGITIRLEQKLEECQNRLAKLNLIPDAPEKSLGESQFFYTDTAITVHGSIASGTSIRIGNDTIVLDRDHGPCVIAMDKASGAIVLKN